MILRQVEENLEMEILSPFAAKSVQSKGRERKEPLCDIRTEFQRDRDRILHCKAFRRMKQKTQVFISPEGDHYRTRLTHTLEVSQIARTIARALRMNEDLTEAIALGHDLGHTPFGHSGERVLNEISESGFEHCKQSVRVVEKIEKQGKGLNLTWEVKNGISNHRSNGRPETVEGKIVQLSDKIAYLNHDIDDALRAKVLTLEEIPKSTLLLLGKTFSKRINTMVQDTIKNSMNSTQITMSPLIKDTMKQLRDFMFHKVYQSPRCEQEESKVETILTGLFEYYMKNPDKMHTDFVQLYLTSGQREQIVLDYIAGMTDRFAVNQYMNIFVPRNWKIY